VFENHGPIRAPWQLKAVVRIPRIQRAVGYAIGIGMRPEHVREEPVDQPRFPVMAKVVFAGFGVVATLTALSFAVWKTWKIAAES